MENSRILHFNLWKITMAFYKSVKSVRESERLEYWKEHGIDKVVNDSSNTANLSSVLPNYTYTKEDMDNFFYSDNGQEEKHNLEESICRDLIGKQSKKPYFYY
jgi:hypothetical protein